VSVRVKRGSGANRTRTRVPPSGAFSAVRPWTAGGERRKSPRTTASGRSVSRPRVRSTPAHTPPAQAGGSGGDCPRGCVQPGTAAQPKKETTIADRRHEPTGTSSLQDGRAGGSSRQNGNNLEAASLDDRRAWTVDAAAELAGRQPGPLAEELGELAGVLVADLAGDLDDPRAPIGQHPLGALEAHVAQVLMWRQARRPFEHAREVMDVHADGGRELGDARVAVHLFVQELLRAAKDRRRQTGPGHRRHRPAAQGEEPLRQHHPGRLDVQARGGTMRLRLRHHRGDQLPTERIVEREETVEIDVGAGVAGGAAYQLGAELDLKEVERGLGPAGGPPAAGDEAHVAARDRPRVGLVLAALADRGRPTEVHGDDRTVERKERPVGGGTSLDDADRDAVPRS